MDNIVDTAGLLRSMAGERWAEVYEHRGVFLEIADELDALKARLAEAQAAAKTWENEAERRSRRYEQAAVRLAEAERLLREIRNRPVGPAGYDSYPWLKVRSRIDAFLRPADSAPAEREKP